MGFNYRGYLQAGENLLKTGPWTIVTPPTVLVGIQEGFDTAGSVVIVTLGNNGIEKGVAAGNLSISPKALLVSGCIPWTAETSDQGKGQNYAMADMMEDLENILKGSRDLGGVSQLMVKGPAITYPNLNGPAGVQRYLVMNYEITGTAYMR